MNAMIRLLALLALLLPMPAMGQSVEDRLETAFRVWLNEAGVTRGAVAIWRGGAEVRAAGVGMQADEPVEIASLSKAVTALCAADLISRGIWTPKTSARDVLGQGSAGITLEALLTHRTGLAPDQTQRSMGFWLDTAEDRSAQAAKDALGRSLQEGTAGQYAYNNENYAILGAMIAAEMREPYANYCTKVVLTPAGVKTAQPSPRTGGFAAWGGWQMSVSDYARLLHWGFGPGGQIGRAPDRWPAADMGGGAFYGMGMTQRAFRGAMNYWHFGALCFPGKLEVGSYAVSWMGDWSVVVAYDACVDWEQMVALDQALAGAVFQ